MCITGIMKRGKLTFNRVHYNEDTKQWYYNNEGKIVDKIVGYDANALYLHCLAQDQLCGELTWIPIKEEYNIEYENETKELNEEEKKTYTNDRQLNKTSTKLQAQMQDLTSQAKWIEFQI